MRTKIILIFLLFAGLVASTSILAQGRDFSELSASERAERAEKESLEAAQDQAFLFLMDKGHQMFSEKHYLKAIRAYEDAGALRPNNVYPPVIIRDIEISMKDTLNTLRKKEAEELDSTKQQRTKPELPDREKIMEEFREKEAERQQKAAQWESEERKQLARHRELKKDEEGEKRELDDYSGSDVRDASLEEFQESLAEEYNEGVTQRSYEEGNRKITERVVVKNNKGNVYKRVEHAWGGKFYFKNGTPISEESWKQETQP